MTLTTLLIIILVIILIGGLPNFGYTQGYGPSGGIGLILLILIVLVLMGKI